MILISWKAEEKNALAVQNNSAYLKFLRRRGYTPASVIVQFDSGDASGAITLQSHPH